MTAVEINTDNAALPEIKGHSVSHSPWGYHATTVGGKRKNKTKQKHKQGGKSNKNKRRSRYTRLKHNKRTRKQRI
jgi:hypothetical protein